MIEGYEVTKKKEEILLNRIEIIGTILLVGGVILALIFAR